MIARQSQAVVVESAKLAETAKTLVEQEAQARADILAAQRELQTQATVIEDERRELMDLRIREPVIAESLKLIGGTLLCCLPLALVGLLLWPRPAESEAVAQLNHLLIREMSGTSSILLGGPTSKLRENPTLPKISPPPGSVLLVCCWKIENKKPRISAGFDLFYSASPISESSDNWTSFIIRSKSFLLTGFFSRISIEFPSGKGNSIRGPLNAGGGVSRVFGASSWMLFGITGGFGGEGSTRVN